MSYFILIGVILIIILLCLSVFYKGLNQRRFSNQGMMEGRISKFLLDRVVPPKSNRNYMIYDDMIYILDQNKNVRDFYFIKIISFICCIFIGISVGLTNIYMREQNAYATNSNMPLLLTSNEYNELTQNVSFIPSEKEVDVSLMRMNSKGLENKDLQDIIDSTTDDNLYDYLKIVNNNLDNIYSKVDLLILLGFVLVGILLPNFILKNTFMLLANQAIFEYDTLETMMLMNCGKHPDLLLRDLEHNALFFRSFLCDFRVLYESSHKHAYELVFNRQEYPERFKKLIRYLNMMEVDGEDNTRLHILNNKELSQEDVFDKYMSINKKRVKSLNFMCGFAFALGFLSLLVSLF